LLPDELDQAVGVARLTDDVVAPLAQQSSETLAKKHIVVGDRDPLCALPFRHTRCLRRPSGVRNRRRRMYRLTRSRAYRTVGSQVGRSPSGAGPAASAILGGAVPLTCLIVDDSPQFFEAARLLLAA